MNKLNSNLVITLWGGTRRFMYPPTIGDRAYFIKRQLETLAKYTNSLRQITFVVPEYSLSKEFTEAVDSLPTEINGTKVVVYHRPNVGMSYGGFSEVYAKYTSEFDYYFFLEDDYLFVKDNWDKEFIDELESRSCAYLCIQKGDGGGVYKMHGAIPMGVLKQEYMQKVVDEFGCLPCSKTVTDYTVVESSQVAFGNAFVKYGLEDFTNKYSAWTSMLGILHCVVDNGQDICVPIQRADKENY